MLPTSRSAEIALAVTFFSGVLSGLGGLLLGPFPVFLQEGLALPFGIGQDLIRLDLGEADDGGGVGLLLPFLRAGSFPFRVCLRLLHGRLGLLHLRFLLRHLVHIGP